MRRVGGDLIMNVLDCHFFVFIRPNGLVFCVWLFCYFIWGLTNGPVNTTFLCSLAKGLDQGKRFSSPVTISLFLINTGIFIK